MIFLKKNKKQKNKKIEKKKTLLFKILLGDF